jgi:deoxycytidine triphosphate deaminase
VGTSLGAVLSDQAIYDLVHSSVLGELIVKDTFVSSALAPASYEPRTARDGLICPDGRSYPPGTKGPAKIVLQSGDAAMFSTRELFRMPPTVAGNVTVKNRLATDGLMLLSGLLIDPGYGCNAGEEDPDDRQGCRLYLHVANIGRDQITIKPGEEPIARIQFLRVSGGVHESRQPIKGSQWIDQEKASLGFLTELKDVKDELKSLKEEGERTNSQVHYVVMGGAVVLSVTLLGVIVAFVLAIVAK